MTTKSAKSAKSAKTRQSQTTKPTARRATTAPAAKRAGSAPPPRTSKTDPVAPKLPSGPRSVLQDIAQRATIRQARERLDRINEMRDASRLAAAGIAQREIADSLRTTQPRVHRLLKAAQLVDPNRETPEEVILRATVEGTDRQTLIKRLTDAAYTFKQHAPEPFDGAVSGTWDQVRAAALAGFLTRHEYELVRDAVKPPA